VTRRIVLVLVLAAVGFVVGGLVGLAAAVVATANARRPRQLVRWLILPVFVAMVVATVIEGPLTQSMSFAATRPMAHLLGLALAISLFVLAVTGRWAEVDSEPEP
jgi:hypothetical protein